MVSNSRQAGPLAQMAVAGNGNALRGALFEFVDPRLGPEMSALSRSKLRSGGDRKDCAEQGPTREI